MSIRLEYQVFIFGEFVNALETRLCLNVCRQSNRKAQKDGATERKSSDKCECIGKLTVNMHLSAELVGYILKIVRFLIAHTWRHFCHILVTFCATTITMMMTTTTAPMTTTSTPTTTTMTTTISNDSLQSSENVISFLVRHY